MSVRPLRRIESGLYESRDGRWRFVGPSYLDGYAQGSNAVTWHTFDQHDTQDPSAWGDHSATLADAVDSVEADLAWQASRAAAANPTEGETK